MTNNDILRRVRYIFNFSDAKMIEIFRLGGEELTRAQVSNWLKKDEDPEYVAIYDKMLACFLNGLIVHNRGKKDGEQPVAEKKLDNNAVFRKLKIALNFKDDDIMDVLRLADLRMSKHELSAFFRSRTHTHYRPCKDQVLRNFLHGLSLKYVQDRPEES